MVIQNFNLALILMNFKEPLDTDSENQSEIRIQYCLTSNLMGKIVVVIVNGSLRK